MKFFGAEVLSHGEGQCPLCSAKVIRVLVNDGSHRSWRATTPEAGRLIPHACIELIKETAVPTAPEAA